MPSTCSEHGTELRRFYDTAAGKWVTDCLRCARERQAAQDAGQITAD